jgi:hypothetical protein
MIRVNNVRMLFRNYRGSPRSAETVARQAMENLRQMAAGHAVKRGKSRTLDRVQCGPLRLSPSSATDEALARMVGSEAWRLIRGRIQQEGY